MLYGEQKCYRTEAEIESGTGFFGTSKPLEKILRELDKQTIPEFTETGRSTADVFGVALARSRHWAACNVKWGRGESTLRG